MSAHPQNAGRVLLVPLVLLYAPTGLAANGFSGSTPGHALGALERFPPARYTVSALVDNFGFAADAPTFEQRVLSYDAWWQPGGPILLYLGNEGPVDVFYDNTGAMFEHAKVLGALVVFVEHRYYGHSQPCGEGPLTSEQLRFLTVEQAMADYAWFIRGLRQRLKCEERACPVVTFGGSYGGMLVAWFRQKYPQLTAGGIGSGAVIDFYTGRHVQQVFWDATMHTFQSFGTPGCGAVLSESLASLQATAATAAGRDKLAVALHSCDALGNESTAGEKASFFLRGIASTLAMLDYPVPTHFVGVLPAYPVMVACERLQRAAAAGDPLHGLRAMADLLLNSTGALQCYDLLAEVVGRPTAGKRNGGFRRAGAPLGIGMDAWQFQACTEFPLQPLTSDGYGFFPPADHQLPEVAASCQLRYNVKPREEWMRLSTGASNLRVGSLLFTDGEKDPWRVGGIDMASQPDLERLDISHHIISEAAHHEDLRFDAVPPRPKVTRAKRLALAAMRRWIHTFAAGSSGGSPLRGIVV